MKRLVVLTIVLSLAVLGLALHLIPVPHVSAGAAQNEGNGFAIIDPDAVAYGTTYAQYPPHGGNGPFQYQPLSIRSLRMGTAVRDSPDPFGS